MSWECSYGRLLISSRSVCKRGWKTKEYREISQYYQICWHCPIKWNANFEQGQKPPEQMWFKNYFLSFPVRSHSWTQAIFSPNIALACQLHNTAVWHSALLLLTGPNSILDLWGKNGSYVAADEGHFFHRCSVTIVGMSLGLSEQIKRGLYHFKRSALV